MTRTTESSDDETAADGTSDPSSGAPPGREQDGAAPPMTMAAALALFAASATEPERRKRIVADVKQAFVREPALAELEPNGHAIRFVLKKLDSTKRGKNIRVHIRAMLAWLHAEQPLTRTPTQVTGEWAALLAQPKLTMSGRFAITRLARYSFIRDILPGDIDDGIIAIFHVYVRVLGTVNNPRKLIMRLINAWNDAAEKVDSWPSTRLASLDRTGPPQRTPNLDQLDVKLAAEIRRCTDWMACKDDASTALKKRFNLRRSHEGGPSARRKRLKDSTILNYGRCLRRSVRILGEKLNKPLSNLNLVEVVDPANVEMIMITLADELTAAGKGERSILSTYCVLAHVAKHYFRLCPEKLAAIDWLGEQISRPEPVLTKKNVGRLRKLVQSKRFELMRLPAFLLKRAIRLIKAGRHQEQHLVDAQVAVAIAVLLTIPIRLGNLAAIRLGEHLDLPMQTGTQGRLEIPAHMVKNDVAIDRCVPVDIAEVLRTYVYHVLPLIRSNPTSTAFFPGRQDDSVRVASGLGTQISRRIKVHIDIEMNTHLFRHFAAILYLEEHPGEYEVVRLLLGNRNLDIVKAYYTGLETDAGIARANEVVAKQQAGLNPKNMLDVVAPGKRVLGRRSGSSPVK